MLLVKQYRKDRKELKFIISKIERQGFKVDNKMVYVRKEDIIVNKDKAFNVHKEYSGDIYYLNIQYEHTDTLPIYADIKLKFRGFKIVDDIYYHNYVASSISGDMDGDDKYMIEKQGFSYGYDDNYNGHLNEKDVLFTFSKRSKLYSSKEALWNDLNKAHETTIQRIKRFEKIENLL